MKRECREWFTQQSTRCNHWKCMTVPLVLEVLMIIQRNICYFTSGRCVTRLRTKMYIFVSKKPNLPNKSSLQMVLAGRHLPKSKDLHWFILKTHIICGEEIEKYVQKPPSPTPTPCCGVWHFSDHSGMFRWLECHFSYCIPRSPGWQKLADNLQQTLNDGGVQQGCTPRNVFS